MNNRVYKLLILFLIAMSFVPQILAAENDEAIVQKSTKELYSEINQEWVSLAERYQAGSTVDKASPGEESTSMNGEDEPEELYSQLRKVADQREALLKTLRDEGVSPFEFSRSDLKTMRLEFILLPTRLFLLFKGFVTELYQDWSGGASGIWNIFKEILLFIVLLLIFRLRFFPSEAIKEYARQRKREVFYLSYKNIWYRRYSLVLELVVDTCRWIVLLGWLSLIKLLVDGTRFSSLQALWDIIQVYTLLKLAQVVIEFSLRRFIPLHYHTKVNKTTNLLSLFVIGTYTLKYSLSLLLGSSLLVLLSLPFFNLLFVILSYYCLYLWRQEITHYFESLGIGFVSQFFKIMSNQTMALFLLMPLFLVFLVGFEIYFYLINFFSQFDWAKKLSAKILRARIGGQIEKSDLRAVYRPAEYIATYKKYIDELTIKNIETSDVFLSKISSAFNSWIEGEEEDRTMALFGSRGAGKTTLLHCAVDLLASDNIRTIYKSVDRKVCTKKQAAEFFNDLTKVVSESPDKKFLFLIDNAHNLFLSKIGGFEAYKEFVEAINDKYENCFWVVTFNEQSWVYLNSVLGEVQYFSRELKLAPWKDKEIKQLILSGHKPMGYDLSYDPVFQISGPSKERVDVAESAENRYFQLLWEQSSGNPGIAIELWLNSLSGEKMNSLKVGLPRGLESHQISAFGSSIYFILNALIRHDNLNLREVAQVTSLSFPVVKQNINQGLDEGIIDKDGHNYRINMKWFAEIVKLLRRKNMLYGNN